MIKKILLPLTALLFAFQMQTVSGQTYTITTVSETVYSGGVPTTNISTCTQDSIVYRITESTRTNDTIHIKLPDGITFVSWLHDSNVTTTHLISQDSMLSFYGTGTGSKFRVSILVNTPPCNAQHTSSTYTTIWGHLSNTYVCSSDNLVVIKPVLNATDISYPAPIILNVGNVDEFVVKLSNIGDVGSKISKIFFSCTQDNNILYYPIGNTPKYYLTLHDSVLNSYYTRYNYPYPTHHNSYLLDTLNTQYNTIDSNAIKAITGRAYLRQGDSLILHIPFFVKNCDSSNGSIQFYTLCALDSTKCNISNDVTPVSLDLGNPLLKATVDTLDNATFCDALPRHKMEVRFKYTNNGTRLGSVPGNARADSIRLYMYCNTGTGIIDISTVKINNVSFSSLYITPYTSGGMNIYLIDFTKCPAGANGHPFGINTIYDMDGSGHPDALAEDSSFEISATFIYDTAFCPPFDQCAGIGVPNTFYLPGIWANYNNQCFTLPYDTVTKMPFAYHIGNDAAYEYQSANGNTTTISAPPDVTNSSPEFDITICPSYEQAWIPSGFNFACPHAYWDIAIPLPTGYHLDTLSSKLSRILLDKDTAHSDLYKYLPWLYDSGGCSHDTFPLNPPIVIEHYHDSARMDTVFINFGKLPLNSCGTDSVTNLLPCITVPLILDCAQFPVTSLYTNNDDYLPFTFQYSCDSGCSGCSNILSCGNTVLYHHCPGTCKSIPYTDSVWSFLRTNLGSINQDLPDYYTTTCGILPQVILSSADSVKTKTGLKTGAAYPGDQIEAKVNGGYDSLIPSHFTNEYLQIRYEKLLFAPQASVFELDPTDSSYFIIRGCVGVPALNGRKLYLPHCPLSNPTCTNVYTLGGPIEMDYSLTEAIQHTDTSLYRQWINDNTIETITDTAVIRLRVMNGPSYEEYPNFFNCGRYFANLRTEFMCSLPGSMSADTFHSCDSWGKVFTLLQPCNTTTIAAGNISDCDSFAVYFTFDDGGAEFNYHTDDFPNEFRPFAELSDTVTVTLPKNYIYGSSTFFTYIDKYDTNRSNNYFKGGCARQYFPVVPQITHIAGGRTLLTYIGLHNSCWPLVDQKFANVAEPVVYSLEINTQPLCTAALYDTVFYSANLTNGTQQSDTAFQRSWKPVHKVDDYARVQHINPTVIINPPYTVIDYSNLISFRLVLCDSGYTAHFGWVAFQNILGDSLRMATATLYDSNNHTRYYGNIYNAGSGVLFNIGTLTNCNTYFFSALIDSNSASCPPPIGGDSGKVLVRYGNNCFDTLANPDSTKCEDRTSTFYYKVYPAILDLTNNGYSPSPVSLCGGLLVDSLTITSAELGTITNPTFWVASNPGFTLDSVTFRHPCGGAKDTNVHTPDTTSVSRTGETDAIGWILNKDLKLHGLRGTLDVTGDSNQICVKVYMTMNCNFNSHNPMQFYVQGYSTCGVLVKASDDTVPKFDSSCCAPKIPRCVKDSDFDLVISNQRASSLTHGSIFNNKKILVIDTFTVDQFTFFSDCDVQFAPNAVINILNNDSLQLDAVGYVSCNHFHAACDSMWQGINIYPGGWLLTDVHPLIEDAKEAVVSINSGTLQGYYFLRGVTFNKCYKGVVVTACADPYRGKMANCIFTCRNLSSYVPTCSWYTNWKSAPFDTLLLPYSLGYSDMGMDVENVDSIDVKSENFFDNLKIGIRAHASNITVDSNAFMNIGFRSGTGVGVYDTGSNASVYTLKVDSNTFRNCYVGVNATYYLSKVNVEYNTFSDYGATPGAYGILVTSMDYVSIHDTLNIVKNTITDFNKGIGANMNNYVNGSINYNTINGDTCTSLNWTGIAVNELSTPFHALYTIDSNRINVLYAGINVTGVYNAKIYDNLINLGPTCSSYLHSGGGIGLHVCDSVQVGCNVITAGFTPNTYSAIIETQSKNVFIIDNNTTKAHIHITFNGNPTTGDSLFDNVLTTGDTGIYKTAGTIMATMGSSGHGTDNSFSGLTCKTSIGAGTTYHFSIGYSPLPGCPAPSTGGGSHNNINCPSVPPPPRNHSMVHRANDSIVGFDSAAIAFLENTALSKDTFYVLQDTNMVIEKEGLLTTIWQNPYLLSDSVLRRFYDSMSNAPMGRILAIDTSMVSINPTNNYSSLLNALNSVIPANNIEANLQAAAFGYLSYRLNDSLSSNQLATLRMLANKCPDWDGNGVYQARALLSLFDPPTTIYSDSCGGNGNDSHRHDKRNGANQTIIHSAFNLYPNPNNGGFTLEYNLEKGQSGTFTIFDMLGKRIATYTLNPNEKKMLINETIMDNGVYLYNIVVNNSVVKQDKLVIIK